MPFPIDPVAGVVATLPPPKLFRSFWMGGFECSTHINIFNERVDMIAGIQHDRKAEEDYALLKAEGMQTARDGVRWHLIEKTAGQYDWSSFEPMLKAAVREKIQVIWDLCHYGWPDGLDIFSPAFLERFRRYCAAVARLVADHTDEVPFYSPVNEISFFSWAAVRDFMHPFAHGRDHDLKRQMVRASIEAMEAIWNVDKRARFTFPEPVINVVVDPEEPWRAWEAEQHTKSQFEVWDMLAGIAAPELGGNSKYLDIIGANFYASNQWQTNAARLRWEEEPRDPRWLPLHVMLKRLWERYRRPIYLAETSHIGVGRAQWIEEIAYEIYTARQQNVPIEGVCLYPILDRYDWQDTNHWHNSGLWNLQKTELSDFRRVIDPQYLQGFTRAKAYLASIGCV